VQSGAVDHDFLTRGGFDCHRRDRIRNRAIPAVLHLFGFAAHAEAIHLTIRGKRAYYHGKCKLAATPVNDIGEEESLALLFFNAADELPAHERMQFCILIHSAVDCHEQALLAQYLEMFVQVEVAAGRVAHKLLLGQMRLRPEVERYDTALF
jgi:hypothetical protein